MKGDGMVCSFSLHKLAIVAGFVVCLAPNAWLAADDGLAKKAIEAQARAVEFFHTQVAVHGGYVYQVSSDLKFREGEGDAGISAVWVQPPGTPAVGMAYVEAYARTGQMPLLAAAKDAANCLVQGQLHSGGWQNHIDFDVELRSKFAYRVDGPSKKKARNWSSFDDDQTQSALRFLMTLDRALKFNDSEVHNATLRGLDGVLRNQYPNGAWAQGFETIDPSGSFPDRPASYPNDWPRKFPGGDYWKFYTLNDQALVRVMQTMWLAYETYEDVRYRDSALKAANFLLSAQMPDPQPAWAQQYNFDMQPVWARKFEPPAVSGGESQVVIEALLDMSTKTGETKYFSAVTRALDYLEKVQLPDRRMARFYELKTDRPLYFTKEYELTYDDSDLPTHYGFKTSSNLSRLRSKYDELRNLKSDELIAWGLRDRKHREKQAPDDATVKKIIAALDDRGAWVQAGTLRYIKVKPADRPMISSETFIQNLGQLSRYIAAHP